MILSRHIEIRREDLPPGILRDLAAAADVEAALALCIAHGAGKIYVPAGRKCLRDLLPVQHIYGGSLVDVPSIRRVVDRALRRSVRADHLAGEDPDALMRRYLISRRTLIRLLRTSTL